MMADKNYNKRAWVLPEEARRLLSVPDCQKYISFADGQVFFCPSLTSPDGRALALALAEEHTDLGRALVDALWFGRPACVTLTSGSERLDLETDVYRCHIAGSLFTKKLLEIRALDQKNDMASAWELRVRAENGRNPGARTEQADLRTARYPQRASESEWHLDHPGLHEKRPEN